MVLSTGMSEDHLIGPEHGKEQRSEDHLIGLEHGCELSGLCYLSLMGHLFIGGVALAKISKPSSLLYMRFSEVHACIGKL